LKKYNSIGLKQQQILGQLTNREATSMRTLYLAVGLLICGALHAEDSPSIADIDLSDPQSLLRASEYCMREFGNGNESDTVVDLCRASFYCGDGGCDAQSFVALVSEPKRDEFLKLAEGLKLTLLAPCNRNDEFESQYYGDNPSNMTYLEAFADRVASTPNIVPYCGKAHPGFEIEVVLAMRRATDVVAAVVRTGGEAGNMGVYVDISEEDFFSLRKPSGVSLQKILQDSLETVLGRECVTSDEMTCVVMLSGGVARAKLLVPGTAATGRLGYWEKSEWEVLASWTGMPDGYFVSVGVPITAIRRSPVDIKPVGNFVSIDADSAFEIMQIKVAQQIAASIGGSFEFP
jgi:hypothetical protein